MNKFNPTLPQIHMLRAALMTLEKDGPSCVRHGICYNVARETSTSELSYDMVATLSVSWPLREGHIFRGVMPCPIKLEYNAIGARMPLWKGRQLDMRLSLIRHLDAELAKLEAQHVPSSHD